MPSEVKEMLEKKIPAAFLPEKAGSAEAVFQIELTGESGGQWVMDVAGGACQVREEVAAKPDVTVKMDSTDFVALFNDELDPIRAFMAGKIKVSGNVGRVMQLLQWFDRG